jgi:hypothetical protein
VVVGYFNVKGASGLPAETESPLVIDSDAVVSFPVSFQSFETICRWNSKVIDVFSGIKHRQFAKSHQGERRKTAIATGGPELSGVFAAKSFNHCAECIA